MIACPKCGDITSVSKVSTLHESGILKGDLKVVLSPPPPSERLLHKGIPVPKIALDFAASLEHPENRILLYVLIVLTEIVRWTTSIYPRIADNPLVEQYLPASSVVILLILVIAIEYAIRRIIEYRKGKRLSHFSKEPVLVYDQRALERWRRAYYCAECYVAFWPDENKVVPAEKFPYELFNY